MLDAQAGTEAASRIAAIIHDQLRPAPFAVKVEVALPLPNIDHLEFEQAEPNQAALGAAPAAVNRTAERQPLSHTAGSTQPGRTLHTARGTQAIHVKLGEV